MLYILNNNAHYIITYFMHLAGFFYPQQLFIQGTFLSVFVFPKKHMIFSLQINWFYIIQLWKTQVLLYLLWHLSKWFSIPGHIIICFYIFSSGILHVTFLWNKRKEMQLLVRIFFFRFPYESSPKTKAHSHFHS